MSTHMILVKAEIKPNHMTGEKVTDQDINFVKGMVQSYLRECGRFLEAENRVIGPPSFDEVVFTTVVMTQSMEDAIGEEV